MKGVGLEVNERVWRVRSVEGRVCVGLVKSEEKDREAIGSAACVEVDALAKLVESLVQALNDRISELDMVVNAWVEYKQAGRG